MSDLLQHLILSKCSQTHKSCQALFLDSGILINLSLIKCAKIYRWGINLTFLQSIPPKVAPHLPYPVHHSATEGTTSSKPTQLMGLSGGFCKCIFGKPSLLLIKSRAQLLPQAFLLGTMVQRVTKIFRATAAPSLWCGLLPNLSSLLGQIGFFEAGRMP